MIAMKVVYSFIDDSISLYKIIVYGHPHKVLLLRGQLYRRRVNATTLLLSSGHLNTTHARHLCVVEETGFELNLMDSTLGVPS